jgi:hypothetical protein
MLAGDLLGHRLPERMRVSHPQLSAPLEYARTPANLGF